MSEPVADRHSDEEYLDAVREHEPAGTSEVAAEVGVARQSADYRLRQLEDEGKVRSKQIGNSLAWSLAESSSAPNEVDPADEFWGIDPFEGAAMSASAIDDVIYGEIEVE